MKALKNHTLVEYTKVLSQRVPVPGGGSAAALTGALGASLLAMVANYSLGKGKPALIEKKLAKVLQSSETLRDRFLSLVDEDAQAYLGIVKARQGTDKVKAKAQKNAQRVSRETCQLCLKAMDLTPDLVIHGNKYLVSDVSVAVEHLLAAFNSAVVLLKA